MIKNRNYGRDREKTLQKYRTAMIDLFTKEEVAILFIGKVMEKYKRYARSVYGLGKERQTYPQEQGAELAQCIENELWSANDFGDVAAYLNQNRPEEIPKEIELTSSTASSGIQVSTRSISEYVTILGGEVNE